MSLFGSSPDDSSLQDSSAQKGSKSLFDDDHVPEAKSHTSLFDDNEDNIESPWSIPTPKKAGRENLVRTLLPAAAVPESYIDAYDILVDSEYRTNSGTVSTSGVKKLIEGTGLEKVEQERILKLFSGGKDLTTGLGRNEYNILLALIGLSQENEEATLDGVDERRARRCQTIYDRGFSSSLTSLPDLPRPSLPLIDQLRSGKVSDNLEDTSPRSQRPSSSPDQGIPRDSPSKSRRLRKESLENIDADPWGSPALHKGHTHIVENEATPPTNGSTAVRPLINGVSSAARTTSAFTTHADGHSSMPADVEGPSPDPTRNDGVEGWTSYGQSTGGFANSGQSGLSPGGFGQGSDDLSRPPGGPVRRSLGGGRSTNRGIEEIVTVTLLPEKEGMFLFQHRNYEIKSQRRGSTVVRRYSDFVWLLDCLHKRYPFRQLPLLPPKTIAGRPPWLMICGASVLIWFIGFSQRPAPLF